MTAVRDAMIALRRKRAMPLTYAPDYDPAWRGGAEAWAEREFEGLADYPDGAALAAHTFRYMVLRFGIREWSFETGDPTVRVDVFCRAESVGVRVLRPAGMDASSPTEDVYEAVMGVLTALFEPMQMRDAWLTPAGVRRG